MNEKNNNGVLIMLVIVLVVALCGTGGYIVYDKFFKEDVKVEAVNDDDKENKEKQKENIDKIDIDVLGEELFNKIAISYHDWDPYFFIKNKLDYNSLENEKRLEIALEYVPFYYVRLYSIDNLDGRDECLPKDGGYVYQCASTKIYKEYFEEAYHKIFGYDKNIKYEDFSFSNSYEMCNLENDYIVCYPFEGGDANGTYQFVYYDRAEQSGNDIVVYVDYLRYEFDDGIYASVDLTEQKIDDSTYYNSIDPKYPNERDESFKEKLFNHYKGKTGKFKVTFKQDKTGNYYWDSSEYISE